MNNDTKLLQAISMTLSTLIHHLSLTGKLDANVWNNIMDGLASDVAKLPVTSDDPEIADAATLGFGEVAKTMLTFKAMTPQAEDPTA